MILDSVYSNFANVVRLVFDNIYEFKITNMNRIEQLIEDRYPGQLEEIKRQIDILSKEYDEEQFLEEDILESVLMELDII